VKKIIFLSLFLLFFSFANAGTTPDKIQKLINKDTAESLHLAAFEYLEGKTVPYDIVKAARLFYRAAEKGDYHSDYWIFDLWSEFGEKKIEPPFPYSQFVVSQKRAIKGYEKRIKSHPKDSEAYYRLSLLLDPGVGMESEEPRAKEYLYKAAQMGHKKAVELIKFIDEMSL